MDIICQYINYMSIRTNLESFIKAIVEELHEHDKDGSDEEDAAVEDDDEVDDGTYDTPPKERETREDGHADGSESTIASKLAFESSSA